MKTTNKQTNEEDVTLIILNNPKWYFTQHNSSLQYIHVSSITTHHTATATTQHNEEEGKNRIKSKKKKETSHSNETNSSIYTYEIVLECKEKSL